MEGIISQKVQMHPFDRDDLSCSLLKAIRKFYSDPANLAKFEEWKKKKEGENHEGN